MRTAPNIRQRWGTCLAFMLVLITVLAMPFTVIANESEAEAQQHRYMFEHLIVMFDPNGGEFPPEEVQEGVRWVTPGTTITDFPPNPTREGFTFDGWRLPNSEILQENSLLVNADINLVAMWRSYADPPANTPSPSPTPLASPSPTPQGGATATPTATPNKDAARPNPGTNPIAISFLIFFAVIGIGVAAFHMIKITARHAKATEQYRLDATRYERESRLAEFIDDDN